MCQFYLYPTLVWDLLVFALLGKFAAVPSRPGCSVLTTRLSGTLWVNTR